VRAPPDRQYEWPYQTKHPINLENRHSEDDIKFTYNPNKGQNRWPSTHEETYSNTYFYEGTNAGHGSPAANPGTNQGQFAQVASFDDAENAPATNSTAPVSLAQADPLGLGIDYTPAIPDNKAQLPNPYSTQRPATVGSARDIANGKGSPYYGFSRQGNNYLDFDRWPHKMYQGRDKSANGIKNWSHDKLPDNQRTFHRYGLVRQPYDYQYEVPFQPRKPLVLENRHNEDDLINVYNPKKTPEPNPNAITQRDTFGKLWGKEAANVDITPKKSSFQAIVQMEPSSSEGVPLWY